MRIAICLSGFMRSYRETAPVWRQVAASLNADIFCSTWDKEGKRIKSPAPDKHADGAELDFDLDPQSVLKLLPVEMLQVDPYEAYEPTFRALAEPIYQLRDKLGGRLADQPKANMSMYYKIWSANELKKVHEHKKGFTYDVVFRSRPDVMIQKIPGECFTNLDTRVWSSSFPPGNNPNETNDLLLISNSVNMNRVCDIWLTMSERISAISTLADLNWLLQPHMLWTKHIQDCGLERFRSPIEMEVRV